MKKRTSNSSLIMAHQEQLILFEQYRFGAMAAMCSLKPQNLIPIINMFHYKHGVK